MDPPAQLLQRSRTVFPMLGLSSVRLDPDGLVHTVVIVNDEWVCRFAKDERGMQALAHEAHVPPRSKATSTWLSLRSSTRSPTSWPPDSSRAAPSISISTTWVELSDGEPGRLAEQLASFLGQVQARPRAELEHHAIGRSAAQRTAEDWQWRHADVERELVD